MIFIEFSLSLMLHNSVYRYYILSYKNTNKYIITSERLVHFEWNPCRRFLEPYTLLICCTILSLFRWKCIYF